MSTISRDADYPDLVWVIFDGKTWDEYYQLFGKVAEFAQASEKPIVIAFHPSVDMPKGAPLAPLKWTADLVKNEPKVLHMYAVVEVRFVIGRAFAQLAAKALFVGAPLTLVNGKDAAYAAFHQLTQSKS
jgi:hypothetical protein